MKLMRTLQSISLAVLMRREDDEMPSLVELSRLGGLFRWMRWSLTSNDDESVSAPC